MRHAVSEFEFSRSRASHAIEVLPAVPVTAVVAGRGVELRLVCLVRAGDSYVVRAAGASEVTDVRAPGGVPAQGGATAQVDIAFGDAGDRRAAAQLHLAVRHIQRWCELGTTVALLDTGSGVMLCGEDGTAVPLPRCAA
jgi:hypothetical protein